MSAPSPTAGLAQFTERLTEHGYVIVPDAIAPGLVHRSRERILELVEELQVPTGDNNFLGERTRRIFNLLARDPLFAELPLLPRVLPVVETVLGPQCLLSSLTAIWLGPGETDQPLHADDGSIPLPRPHVPITCVAMVALTDYTEANGATRLVPASHRRDRRPAKGETAATVAAEMPAGSALVYNGSLWHHGGANLTDDARVGVVVNYCAGWVRQEECQLLAVPRESVAAFPRRLQELVGYGTYKGLIGHVDQESPARFVDPSAETDMVWRRFG